MGDIYSQYSYKNYLAKQNETEEEAAQIYGGTARTFKRRRKRKRHIVFVTSLLILLVAICGSIGTLYFRGFDFGSVFKGNAKGEYKMPEMTFYTVEIQGINEKKDAVAKSYEMAAVNGAGYIYKPANEEPSAEAVGEETNKTLKKNEGWTLVDSVYLTSADAARRMAEQAAASDGMNTVLDKYTILPKAIPESVYSAIMAAFNKLTEERANENTDFVAANLYLELKKVKAENNDNDVKYLLNQCILALYNLSYKAINVENAIAAIIFALYAF
jgi:hypothetical protein